MKTVIDELSLKIDIKVKKDIDKTISSIATAINRLNKAVADVGALKKYVNTLNKLTKRNIKITSDTGVSKTVKKEAVPVEKTNVDVVGQGKEELNITNQTTEAKKEKNQETQKEIDLTKKKRKENKKTDDEEEKYSKKSLGRTSKLIKSLGRIALYRAARTVIKEIVQGATEGLANIRSVDKELDTSMKKVSQSYTSLKNSFASLLSPIIKTIEPVITSLADTFANISNRINEARAALNGQTKYTKILTSDSEEYKKNLEEATGTLLDFDKFSVLNKKEQGYTGVIESDVTMSEDEAKSTVNNLKLVETGLIAIATAIALIQALKFANTITTITSKLKDMVKGSKKATDALNTQKQASQALATTGILALSAGIITLIANWNQMSDTAKVLVPVLSVLAGVITALVVGLSIAKGNWLKALSIGGIVTGTGLAVGSTLSAMKFADGGFPKQGQLFIAREAGAELVGTMGGKTAVANNDQIVTGITQGVYNAMMAYNSQTRNNNGGDVYLDGTKVGRVVAKGSHQEMVRVGLIKANS